MLNPTSLSERVIKELNRLCKWRTVFAGWQLGTRPTHDPECQAVRDQREVLLLLRVELSALTNVLITKKVLTLEEFQLQLLTEVQHMQANLEKRFPGFKATDTGVSIDPKLAAETTKGWQP